ncbi:MAG: helix-turn-helix transcriptional regulator, partial [Roseibium sp.]
QDLQLAQATTATSMQERVRACLIGAIGDGDPSIAYICECLSRSRTGLLRELQAEGVTFQGILTDTRKSLALRYLRNSDMPVKQVASLLAYRDTNAFHRAFRAWTGQTPARVRATRDDACQV